MNCLLAVYPVFIPMGHHHSHGPMTEKGATVFSVVFLICFIGAIDGCAIHVHKSKKYYGDAEFVDYLLGLLLGFVVTFVGLLFISIMIASIKTLFL
jgi:hypothetical protein